MKPVDVVEPVSEPTTPKDMRKICAAGAVGTGIELYDFLIFGLAAGLVFPKLFFPGSDPLTGTLLSFMAFGAGFVSRPLGGVVFGHFGDRVSRKMMLVVSLVATGLCTMGIGVLPTYAAIGTLAPILLVTLRVLQGFFMGGEQAGAFVVVTEHAPAGRRAFFGAFVTAGSPLGSILGIGVFNIVAFATGAAFVEWGWRIPFLASAVLVAVGLFVRLSVDESPVFQRFAAQGAAVRSVPLWGVLTTAPHLLIGGLLVNLGFNLFIYIINSFTSSYGTQQLGIDRGDILLSGLWGSLAMLIFVFVAGKLADSFGLARVMLLGAIFQVLWAFPYFWLLDTRGIPGLYLAVVVAYVGLSFVFGPMAAFYVSLFRPEVRYSGIAASYNLGAVLGGGLSPAIATALVQRYDGSAGVSLYIAFGGVLSALGLLITVRQTKTAHNDGLV